MRPSRPLRSLPFFPARKTSGRTPTRTPSKSPPSFSLQQPRSPSPRLRFPATTLKGMWSTGRTVMRLPSSMLRRMRGSTPRQAPRRKGLSHTLAARRFPFRIMRHIIRLPSIMVARLHFRIYRPIPPETSLEPLCMRPAAPRTCSSRTSAAYFA